MGNKVEAVEATKTLQDSVLRDYVASHEFHTVMGTLAWDNTGRPKPGVLLVQWQNGQQKIIRPAVWWQRPQAWRTICRPICGFPSWTHPAPPPTPTGSAAQEPLNYGFEFQFCTIDGDNYTCNVRVWGTGGDGKYHFALENPDTGNWDEKTGGSASYLMRSRRCRVKVQQLRIWDESGNHIEPNLTMDPDAMPDKFPGGTGCTP